jgi:2-hydroxy-3-keto-5-methylthiopentenyl-1-phosphate phosphatase
MKTKKPIRYLVASDFDKTLSFNDSGHVLGEIIGVKDFEDRVSALSSTYLVQSGAELAYLLRHDPKFREVRRNHLVEAGKRVRLKDNVKLLAEMLATQVGITRQFVVISAGPRETVRSTLEGIVLRMFSTNSAVPRKAGRSYPSARVCASEKCRSRLERSWNPSDHGLH